jgi:hypothetical protein
VKTKTFTGTDQADIDNRIGEWQAAVPGMVIVTRHPLERLPPDLQPVNLGAKVEAVDLVIQRIDYKGPD